MRGEADEDGGGRVRADNIPSDKITGVVVLHADR